MSVVFRRFAGIVLTAVMLLSVCGTAALAQESEAQEVVGSYLPGEGECTGNVKAKKDGSVTGFKEDGDACTVPIDIPETGFFDLVFTVKAQGGYKENYVWADGQQAGTLVAQTGKEEDAAVRRVYLEKGAHEITVSKYWGYIDWLRLTVLVSEPFDESIFDVSPRLADPEATENARRLFSYLCDEYGKSILSGQYCDTGANGWENMKIAETNGGRYPAILGLDLGYYSQTGVDHGASVSTTEQAIAYWEKGGIVTLCWHWLAPEKYISGTWYSAFRPEECDMDLTAIMNGEDEEGMALLKKDIGNIAVQLQAMQEAGVPILWRPLHEASGGWFWWGAEGPDTYKKLYILLYDMLTNEYGLHNLIWVWNGQNKDWYPGDEYVDIIGMDIYAGEHVYTSQIDQFLLNHSCSPGNKMVVLSENGTMIDPDLAVRDRAMWGFFCTWSGEFVLNDGVRKTYSERYTDAQMLTKVYNSDVVITRDELPDLLTYPIKDGG